LTDLTLTDQIAGVDIDGPQLKQQKLNKILLNALKTKQNTSQLAFANCNANIMSR